MGHASKKTKNLKMQAADILQAKLNAGQGKSKHDAKKEGGAKDCIFSFLTYKTYKEHIYHFCEWMKEAHADVKDIKEARKYCDEYIAQRIEAGFSPYTLKAEVAAFCKVFGDTAYDYIRTPERNRENLTRSRGRKKRDRNFNEDRHADFVKFCKGTGLRRAEITALRGDYLTFIDGKPYLDFRGQRANACKGGRPRLIPITASEEDVALIVKLCQEAGDKKVFPVVNANCDIHSYRQVFCQRVYNLHCRDIAALKPEERYICRGDRAGVIYDRQAMKYASEALGHARIDVIAQSYLDISQAV